MVTGALYTYYREHPTRRKAKVHGQLRFVATPSPYSAQEL